MAVFTKFVPKQLIGIDDLIEFEFSSQEELLNLFCVKCWTLLPNSQKDENFHQFSLKQNILVVESFGGIFHVEIGSLSSTNGLTLPEWKEFNEKNSN